MNTIERLKNTSRKTSLTLSSLWLLIFIIGLIIILVSAKQVSEKEITKERWEELQKPGWTLLVISILFSPFLIVSLVLFGLSFIR